jgi:spore maturation protein CgeB
MKVLYLGKFSPRTHSDIYIAKAMEKFGWEVKPVNVNKAATTELVQSEYDSFSPDIVFCGKVRRIDWDFFKKVRQQGKKVVTWYGDQRGTPAPDWVNRLAQSSDWFLLTNSGQLDYFKKVGAKNAAFWPLASDVDIFKPRDIDAGGLKKYGADIIFVGGDYGGRFRHSMLRRNTVVGLSNVFKVRTYGEGWKSKGKIISMKKAMMEDCAKVLSASKLSLGMNNYVDIPHYQSHRTWTHMASGSCLMNYATPGIDSFFKDRVHQVFWTEFNQLVQLCSYYLKHDDEREKIQKAARQLIVEEHTFNHRIALLDKILKGERSGIRWDQRV